MKYMVGIRVVGLTETATGTLIQTRQNGENGELQLNVPGDAAKDLGLGAQLVMIITDDPEVYAR